MHATQARLTHRVGRAREVAELEGVDHHEAALAVGARRHERAELGADYDGAVGEDGDAHLRHDGGGFGGGWWWRWW